MLNIALVRFKAKCARHPRFNPDIDGRGAIHGNCSRCNQLQEIHDSHRRTLQLIRAFGPPATARSKAKRTLSVDRQHDKQQLLFGDPNVETDRPK